MSSGDEVLVRGESVRDGAKLDAKVSSGLGGVDGKTSRSVSTTTRSSQEGRVSSAGDVDQGGAGVDNTRGAGSESRGAVGEARNGDAPVRRSSAACKLGVVGERASVLCGVDATKGQLAVGVLNIASGDGLEGNAENLGGNETLAEQVVRESRDSVGVGDGALGEINRTKTDDSVHAGKSGRPGSRANGLTCDSQTAEADPVSVLRAGE